MLDVVQQWSIQTNFSQKIVLKYEEEKFAFWNCVICSVFFKGIFQDLLIRSTLNFKKNYNFDMIIIHIHLLLLWLLLLLLLVFNVIWDPKWNSENKKVNFYQLVFCCTWSYKIATIWYCKNSKLKQSLCLQSDFYPILIEILLKNAQNWSYCRIFNGNT